MTDTDRGDPPDEGGHVGEGNGALTDVTIDVRDVTTVVDDYAAALLDAGGRVATWNEAAGRITGYDEDEIVGTHYRVLFPDGDREARQPERLLERARTEGRAEDVGWRIRSDGGRFWAREVLVPIGDGDFGVDALEGEDGSEANEGDEGDEDEDEKEKPDNEADEGDGNGGEDPPENGGILGYGWFVHDRTDDHERQQELRAEKAFTESVLDAQPDILYACDVDGQLRDWNDRFEDVTGYDADELSGAEPVTFVAPGDRMRIRAAIERVLEEGDRVTAEGHLLTDDGERIPYEFNSARITDDQGTVLGCTGVGRDVSERNARERELREEQAFLESVFAAQPDIVYAFDATRDYIRWNDRVPEVTGYSEAELAEMDPLEFVAPEDRERIDAAIERVLEEAEHVTAEADLLTNAGERIPYEFNSARITDDEGRVLGFTGVGRDVSDRTAREQELERLEELNAVFRAVDEEIVDAESREEIEAAVVERFAAADPVRFAAISRTGSVRELPSLEAAAGAGVATGTASIDLEDLVASFVAPPADAAGGSPLEDRRGYGYASIAESEIEAWRTDARERGYGAVAVVPLVASDRELGVLLVAAVEPTPFSDRELGVLEEFGATVGHAIDAMTLRRLLYMDAVVELEFESTDRGDVCVDLSERADCRLTLDHVLPLTDEVFVYYVTAADADPERLREAATDHPSIRDVRRIDIDGTESHWEFVVAEEPIAGLFAEYGGRIRSKVVDHGVSTDLVQVSPDANVRELVDAVTAIYPDATLVSKHTVDQPVRTRGDFRREVEELLTDRQRTALEAAYYGGYFEWPRRRSDAGDLADQLGIARQTFHQHLRVALEKLLTVYLEGSP
ncbi:PAS/PAC sensor protein [Halobiforma lacisalsi AJ5]|uniref:PAS/PAC sensor protein n=1 Tax=Natronobacterium lacisalsi AJ5 TaxID=358396 RepID=M0LIC1_NATLA|nr:PAS domain S-box protein [Halobiforma lacisalsi]EMA31745.1 PAS/PAC sensor protein [Halobiforma lacisalsi AJ5]